jgi:dTDP-L-rhamnose 4-epimerase
LLEALAKRPIERLIVASSMSVYGEGRYRDADGGHVDDADRAVDDLRARRWEPRDSRGRPLEPIPTPETKTPRLASIYALSKFDQEQLCLITARAYGIPAVALRFFNVYGPNQALSNPYTGVLAIFAARLLHGRSPILFEDGHQRRDFVHASDVAQACALALASERAAGKTLNVGSGEPRSIREVAERMAQAVGRPEIQPEVAETCRAGDIRHCFADIGEAERVLGYRPRVRFEEGLVDLAEWLSRQRAVDRVAEATRELSGRGLTL